MAEVQQLGVRANNPPPAAPAAGAPAGTPQKTPLWRRRPAIIIGTLILFVGLFYGLGYLADSWTHEATDDAFVAADVVAVAPKVAAQVKKVHVTDNQLVHTGDLLVELDPRDFQVALDEKAAAVKTAQSNVDLLQAQLDLSQAQVSSAEATAKQSAAEVAAARATADRAASDFKRAQDLIQNKTISPQEFDTAQAATTAAEANVRAAKEKAASDQAKVAEAQAQVAANRKALARGEAFVHEADWNRQAAELNLSYTRVTAPTNGYITKKAVADGDYLQVGQRLMALVPDQGVYVIANFKETQLKQIRTGQPVQVDIDSVARGPFPGHVNSIMAGSGAAFSLLPPENAVGNYVKVVQRVPVKITFDHPVDAPHVLGPGLSVVPSVHVTNWEISETVVLVVAAALAIVVGILWWAGAGKRRA